MSTRNAKQHAIISYSQKLSTTLTDMSGEVIIQNNTRVHINFNSLRQSLEMSCD